MIIEKPPMVTALSPTSMGVWKQCPRRFYYEKILRIRTLPGAATMVGSFVHQVLEHLMRLPACERTQDQAKVIASEQWPKFVADETIRFFDLGLDNDEERLFKHRAWLGVLGYFMIEDPTEVEVAAIEVSVAATLGTAPVHGFIDRLDQGPNGVSVTDYKSGKIPTFGNEKTEKLGQLRTYGAMLSVLGHTVTQLRLLFVSPQLSASDRLARYKDALAHALANGGDVDRARKRVHYAKNDIKVAKPTVLSLQVTEEDLLMAHTEATEIWEEVNKAYESGVWPGKTGVLCDWCPFSSMCTDFQAWDKAGRPKR